MARSPPVTISSPRQPGTTTTSRCWPGESQTLTATYKAADLGAGLKTTGQRRGLNTDQIVAEGQPMIQSWGQTAPHGSDVS